MSSTSTKIGAGLSTAADTVAALREAAAAARTGLGDAPADLALVFVSHSHLDAAEPGLQEVGDLLEPGALIGCCAQGVLGGEREVEEGPGAAVWAMSSPRAGIDSFHLSAEIDDGELTLEELPASRGDLMLLLADPFSFPADALLDRTALERPGLPVVGGLASGAVSPDDAVLFRGTQRLQGGAVGVLLDGVQVVPCVSQGAAPIGPEMVVTAGEGNVVLELASRPALEKLRAVLGDLERHEQELAARGLLVGIVVDENKPAYERGDFLVRGLLGADESTGAIAVGDNLRVGQTVRLHVRDASSADEDLSRALDLERAALAGGHTAGALLFTCNGRGRQMFGEANHDAGALARSLGSPPLAGFFCAGEIGPVGGRSFLHGFTATMALFADDEPL